MTILVVVVVVVLLLLLVGTKIITFSLLGW